jgi:cytokinin riboside 5'-monophosphate phosphoribohydrolase
MIPFDSPEQGDGAREPVRSLAICVFCGSRPGRRAGVDAVAGQVGALIGRRGHELVYGGSGSGLMGAVARAARLNGALITGYVPQYIYELELGIELPKQTLHVTHDLFERKRRMIEHGDAFIALPGGYGTLDEIAEVLSLSYLSLTTKPLVLLNTDNYWDGLVDLVKSLHEGGFADRAPEPLFRIAGSPDEAITMAEEGAKLMALDSKDKVMALDSKDMSR